MRTTTAPFFCLFLAAAACATETSGADASHAATLEATQPAQTCTIAPRPDSQLPRGSLDGEPASKVKQAVDALLSGQTQPLPPGQSYVIPKLSCIAGSRAYRRR